MDFSIHASITPNATARLIISGEISTEDSWTLHVANKVLDEIHSLSVDAILRIIDSNQYGSIADMHNIPQFGKIDTLVKVPSYFTDNGNRCVDYPQLGFYLKPDPNATLGANTKFGENHGKTAAILGIVNCINQRIVPSALSYAFAGLNPCKKQEIIKQLLFRIPIVQILLSSAKVGQINGYDAMAQLKASTRYRRGQCLRSILKALREYNHTDLNARLDNIVWIDR